MATYKQGSRRTAGTGDRGPAPETFTDTLAESARQIWLAGVGAFGRAQAEGGKLFDSLVRDGLDFEQATRKFNDGAEQVRERASGTWDKLEKTFDDRVQRTLHRLGVPDREDLAELNRRLDGLTAELRRANDASAHVRGTATAARPQATARSATAAKPAARKPATRKPVTGKPVTGKHVPDKGGAGSGRAPAGTTARKRGPRATPGL